MNISSSITKKFNQLPLGIRGKVTLPYLLLAIFLIFGAAFVVTRVVFDTIEERFTNQLLESAVLATERMVVEEEQMLESFRLLAFSNGVTDAIIENDPDELRELLFGTIVNNRMESVVFVNLNEELVFSAKHIPEGNVEEYEFSSGGKYQFSDLPFIQNVFQEISDEYAEKFVSYVNESNGPTFYIAGPVYSDSRDLAGVLLIGKSIQKLSDQIRQETLAQVTIYDFEGQVLSSTFLEPSKIDKQIVDEIVQDQDDSSLIFTNNRLVDVRNIGYREILTTWEVRNKEDLGILGIALGESFLVSTTNATRFNIALLTGFVLLLVILIGLNLSKIITTPILDLVKASEKVMDGDLTVQVQTTSNDELAVMANSFNQMVESVRSSQGKIIESYDSTLEGWTRALDLRNHETKGHTDRVLELMDKTIKAVGVEQDKLEHIRRGCLLHDIGKMAVPDQILNKPGPLSDEEWKIMRQHPVYAYEMLKDIHFLTPALPIPYCHHEKWDGTGYPQGLKGEEIPLEARIFALVDVWDALTSDRVYRKALSEQEAAKIIRDGMGTHFDPKIADLFLKVVNE